jgi:hypothetical protein
VRYVRFLSAICMRECKQIVLVLARERISWICLQGAIQWLVYERLKARLDSKSSRAVRPYSRRILASLMLTGGVEICKSLSRGCYEQVHCNHAHIPPRGEQPRSLHTTLTLCIRWCARGSESKRETEHLDTLACGKPYPLLHAKRAEKVSMRVTLCT